jgi:hypothetical protein
MARPKEKETIKTKDGQKRTYKLRKDGSGKKKPEERLRSQRNLSKN